MPMAKYDAMFGGKKGAAAKAHAAMVEQYGPDKADEVFYATMNTMKNKMMGKGKTLMTRGH